MRVTLISLVFLVGCGSPSRSDKVVKDSVRVMVDSVSKDGVKVLTAKKVLPAFMKLDTVVPFAGVYVNATYLKRIRRNHSPSKDQLLTASCLVIPARTLRVTRMVSDFHDGAGDMVVLKAGDKWQFYSRDLATALDTIEVAGDSSIFIGGDTFIRMQHGDTTKSDWGILEEVLFAGKYMDARGGTVVFSPNGEVSGLDSFAFYRPQIDYAEMDRPVDHVQLRWTYGSPIDLGFRFVGDSLVLYTIDCVKYGSSRCSVEKLGERIFSLVKVK